MEIRYIEDELTELKISNKKEKGLVDQLKFFGAIPTRESSVYTYFRFNGNMVKTADMLGVR